MAIYQIVEITKQSAWFVDAEKLEGMCFIPESKTKILNVSETDKTLKGVLDFQLLCHKEFSTSGILISMFGIRIKRLRC